MVRRSLGLSNAISAQLESWAVVRGRAGVFGSQKVDRVVRRTSAIEATACSGESTERPNPRRSAIPTARAFALLGLGL